MDQHLVEKAARLVKLSRQERKITKAQNRKWMDECRVNPQKVMDQLNEVNVKCESWFECTESMYPIINLAGIAICVAGIYLPNMMGVFGGTIMIFAGHPEAQECIADLCILFFIFFSLTRKCDSLL